MYEYPTQTPKPKNVFKQSSVDPKTEALGLILRYGIENFYSSFVPELQQAIAGAGSDGNNPKGVPDPVAGGTDGFRFFKDWKETGGSISNTSGAFPDVFCTLMYVKSFFQFKDCLTFIFECLEDKSQAPITDAERAVLLAKQGEIKNREPTAEEKQERLVKIEKTYSNCKAASKSPEVATYLSGRGLKGDFSLLPNSIGYAPTLWYGDSSGVAQKLSGMVGIMSDVNGKPWTLHRTFLDPVNHSKAQVDNAKLVMKSPVSLNGLSIKLDEPVKCISEDGKELVVLGLSEGIETSLAIREGTGVPMWACYNNFVMEAVELPPEVNFVIIYADKDAKGAGQLSAQKLAEKLRKEGIQVVIELPPSPIPEGEKGIDWLDEYNLTGLESFDLVLDDNVGVNTGVNRFLIAA